MIIGIGTDMIEIERVIKACEKESFLIRYFTVEERELIQSDRNKAADNFAVKEAVAKVFGTGFGKIEPIEIECLRDSLGKPYIKLYGKAKELGECMGISKIHVSITNTKKYASAFAVGEALVN
ncbi:holo-ACP synthase [Velocimicrobium porci]|uniref:Holo-[acyl-carrier-protein] synthase n=1 Tax=Velocimicrobium porci TaxID=2606634 RepID=A0A6L5XUJ1_9FIRM|nr:holo-ACP synthase [Velocimicrobium porci]MSS62455.1 holo-[acyl-carrier-protein] synthase [Velocimicrobium porci]